MPKTEYLNNFPIAELIIATAGDQLLRKADQGVSAEALATYFSKVLFKFPELQDIYAIQIDEQRFVNRFGQELTDVKNIPIGQRVITLARIAEAKVKSEPYRGKHLKRFE